MFQLKPVSNFGKGCFSFLSILVIAAAAAGISSAWWSVWFWDCAANNGVSEDNYFVISLPDGLCYSADSKYESDACTTWEDLQDLDGIDQEAQDDAGNYISAQGLLAAAIAFACVFLLATIASFFFMFKNSTILRYVQVFIMGLVTLLFIGTLGIASNTYYTRLENYDTTGFDYYNSCSSNLTAPAPGWIAALIGFFIAVGTVASVVFPCCNCIDKNADTSMTKGLNSQA